MKALWLCEDFAPAGGVGMVRLSHLLRAQLDAGFECAVIAGETSEFPVDEGLWKHAGLTRARIHRIPSARRGEVGRAATLWSYVRGTYCDRFLPWVVPAVEAAREVAGTWVPDWVCVSAPRWDAVAAAGRLASEFGARLAIDYRDPFIYAHRPPGKLLGPLRGKALLEQERSWLRPASLVTVVTPDADWIDPWLRPYAARVEGLSNGFEPAVCEPPDVMRDGTVQVVFTGKVRDRFMAGWLQEFASRLAEACAPTDARLWVLGEIRKGCEIESDLVRATGFRPHDEVRSYQAGADLLLHVLSPSVEARYQTISAKVFEYLAGDAPILAVEPPSALSGRVVEQNGRGVTIPSYDTAEAAAAAVELLENRKRYRGDRALINERYAWPGIRARYLQLMSETPSSKI